MIRKERYGSDSSEYVIRYDHFQVSDGMKVPPAPR